MWLLKNWLGKNNLCILINRLAVWTVSSGKELLCKLALICRLKTCISNIAKSFYFRYLESCNVPGTAKRKCEPSSSVNSGVHEQKAAVNAIQPLGGISTLQLQFFSSSQLDVTSCQNNDRCSLGMISYPFS